MTNDEQKTNTQRRYVGLRMQRSLYFRLERVAQEQESNIRSVIEQLAKLGLPRLERLHGLVRRNNHINGNS